MLHGVCDKVRGDGDNHMRGIGCLLTGIELFPGNIQGGSAHAGRLGQRHLDRPGDQEPSASQTRRRARRFGSLEFGVMVPERADTWTRMVYAGPNKPIAPIDDPYQMFAKLYGRVKDQETLKSVLDDVQDDLKKVERRGQRRGPPAARRARHVRPRDGAGAAAAESQDVGHAVPELEPGVKHDNDNIPRISKMQIDLMVNSFAADFARVATLQYTNSVGGAKMRWLGDRRRAPRAVARARQQREGQDKLTKINRWYCEQLAYLAKRLAETPEPGGSGSLLDNTLIVWTNELGKGNSHTLDNIPVRAGRRRARLPDGPLAEVPKVPHNRLLLSLAHGFGHEIKNFGNGDFCAGGPLSLS